MAPNDRARQNHDSLFPNHVSALATTDPEMIDVFDNFAFDEVCFMEARWVCKRA